MKKILLCLFCSLIFFGCGKPKMLNGNVESFLDSIQTNVHNIYYSAHSLRVEVLDKNKVINTIVYEYRVNLDEENKIKKQSLKLYDNYNKPEDVKQYYYFNNGFYFMAEEDENKMCKTIGSEKDIYKIMGTNPFDTVLLSNVSNYKQGYGVALLKLATNLKKHCINMDKDYSIVYKIHDSRLVLNNLKIECFTYKKQNCVDSYIIYGKDEKGYDVNIKYETIYEGKEQINIPQI